MALFCGKVIAGKHSGLLVDVGFLMGITIGNMPVAGDIASVQLIGNTTKVDLVFSLKPIKGYYQVLVTWKSGGQSILEVNQKAFTALMNTQM